MRICYVALSPTFGMQQYTADLANQVGGAFETEPALAWPVAIVTNRRAPRDRYALHLDVQPVVDIAGTGIQKTNFNLQGLRNVYRAIRIVRPDVVHLTGPHIWNPILLLMLKQAKIRTVHTIHDLDPHSGSKYGRLLYAWNNSILHWADHIIVHGQVYQQRLMQQGVSEARVSYLPLLHLFLSYETEAALRRAQPAVTREPFALFFARLETYKGLDILFEAARCLNGHTGVRVIVAGRGELQGAVPDNVEVRNRLVGDSEAVELFSRCSLVVLPYRDATQSALIAASYFFQKPVVVTRTGALPEYVSEGITGWIIEPGDAQALADCMSMISNGAERLRQMGQAGRAWYEAHYHSERSVLTHIYERVARA